MSKQLDSDIRFESIFFRTLYSNDGKELFDYENYGGDILPNSLRREILIPFAERIVSKFNKPTVVDLGTGMSPLDLFFKDFGISVIRLDIGDNARELKSLDVQANALKIPLVDHSIHGVFCKDMISHIWQPLRPLLYQEIKRICVPKAEVAIMFATIGDDNQEEHQYKTTPKQIGLGLRAMGFSPTDTLWHPESKNKDWYLGQQRHTLQFEIN